MSKGLRWSLLNPLHRVSCTTSGREVYSLLYGSVFLYISVRVSWMETFPVWDCTVTGQEVSEPRSSLQVSFPTYRTGASCSNLPTLSSTRTLLGGSVCIRVGFGGFKGQGEMYSFNWVP